MPKRISVYTAELYAIWPTLHIIMTNNIKQSVIFKDSLSAIQSISYRIRNKMHLFIVYKIRKAFMIAKRKNFFNKMVWIPSYSGISGNDRPDVLARIGVRMSPKKYFKTIYL